MSMDAVVTNKKLRYGTCNVEELWLPGVIRVNPWQSVTSVVTWSPFSAASACSA
jgi:hypothetical protein